MIENKAIFSGGTYLALGSFDGLHIGHITLIREIVKLAKDNNGKSMVYSFKNHPLSFIAKEKAPKLLMNNETKIKILKEENVDVIELVDFDENLMKNTPRDFIKNIVSRYNIKGIVVGFNYRFGFKNEGDTELLRKLSKEFNFNLKVMPPCLFSHEIVSSTNIRTLISDGKIFEANQLLPEPYSLYGIVIKGRQIGRTIGFPTANLQYDESYIKPAVGIYYTNVEYNKKIYKGITNVGYNPTVNGNNLSIETYILNFNEDIYGKHIKVFFLEKIRDEHRFNSVEELKAQLVKDKNYAEIRKIIIK